MDEPKRRQVHVFISEIDVLELFTALIKEVIKDKYDFKVTVTTYDNELLEMAKHHAFDLFILYLNNIIFPSGNQSVETRIKKALRLIIHLKAKYRKPVIGLYGWPKDSTYGRQAKLAGADFVFRTPCSGEVLRQAIKTV
jgi:DNA-binding NarL/FixJ family response regulator